MVKMILKHVRNQMSFNELKYNTYEDVIYVIIVVTDAVGFIGSYLSKRLLEQNIL